MHTYGHAPVFLHLEYDSMQCALQEFPQSFFYLALASLSSMKFNEFLQDVFWYICTKFK